MEVHKFKKLIKDRMVGEYTKLLKKNGELKEENDLLIAQAIQEEKSEPEEAEIKKPSEMNEFELAEFMRHRTSKKVF